MTDHSNQSLSRREMVRTHAYPLLATVSSLSLIGIVLLLLPQTISLYTRNFSAQSAYQTDADIYLEDKDGVAWDELTVKLHLQGQLKTEEREDVERALVNAGFEQMSKTHWIPIKGHPKGGKSLRRYWVRKGLVDKPNTSNTSAWLGRRMGFNDGGSGLSDY